MNVTMRSVLVFTAMILITLLLFPLAAVQTQEQVYEEMHVVVMGKYTYVELNVNDYSLLRNNIEDFLENSRIDGIKLMFVYQGEWKSSYRYFLDMNLSLLSAIGFPSNKMIITLEGDALLQEDNILNLFESAFMTRFIRVGNSYVASVGQNIFLSFLSRILPQENYTPFLNWLNPLAMITTVDILGISIEVRDGTAFYSQFIMRELTLADNRLRLSGILATSAPYSPQEGVVSKLTMDMYSVYIYEKPGEIELTYNPELDVYRFIIEDFENMTPPAEFALGVYDSTPFVLVHRSFNTSTFNAGSYVEVYLNVTIPEASPNLFNVSIKEVNWWSGIGEFIEGSTERQLDALGSGSSEILRYVVRIESEEQLDLTIPPATVHVPFLGGKNLTVLSNNNILHLNREAPLISISISPISDTPVVGEEFRFIASISNDGASPAENVLFIDFLVGTLDPGRSVKVNESITLFGEGSLEYPLKIVADYTFEDEKYTVESMSLTLQSRRDLYYKFALTVELTPVESNITFVSYQIVLRNDAPKPVVGIEAIIQLYSETSFNISEEYETNGTHIFVPVDVIEEEQSYTIVLNVTYPEAIITLVPEVLAFVEGELAYAVGTEYFYNVIDIKIENYTQYLVKGQPYTFDIVFINIGPEPVYNLSMAWTRTVEEVIILPEDYTAPEVPPRSNETIPVNLTAVDTGEVEMPGVRFIYTFLGKSRSSVLPLDPINIFEGIKIEPDETSLVVESGDKVDIKLQIIVDDPELYKDLAISIDVPEGLVLLNETVDGFIMVEGDVPSSIVLSFEGGRPGPYTIKEAEIRYTFANQTIEDTVELDVSIRVREDIVSTYMIWLIPGLVIALAVSVLIRKRISG